MRVGSTGDFTSGVPRGDERAAFSVARFTIDRGRLRGPCEDGRCCQLRVGFRCGIAFEGDGWALPTSVVFPSMTSFCGDSGVEVEGVALELELSRSAMLFGEARAGAKLLDCVVETLDRVGVVPGDDFVGDMDRARSRRL